MKTFLPTLIVLSSLLGLVSCGQGGQSSASLQVSRGFAMTNPNFGGGLIIAGKNLTTGKSFSKGLTTTMSINLNLDKGTWLITATGWDGGSTSNVPFGGLPYCGKVTKSLVNDSETVDLSVTTTECASSFFAGTHQNMAGTSVKAISLINTCNTFFGGPVSISDVISSSVVASGTGTDTFCENIAPDLQTKVESVKIYALNKDFTSALPSLGFSSGCLKAGSQRSLIDPASTTPSNAYQSGSELRLPVGGIPFFIVTFEDNTCSKPLAQFPFKNGLGAGDPEKFDHLLLSRTSNEMKLILPGNDLRRGYSAFEAIYPYFKRYNTNSPLKFQTQPVSNAYSYHGFISQNNIAVLENESSCNTVTYDGTTVTNAICAVVDGRVQVTWTASATEGAGSIVMNGNTYPVYADNVTFGLNRFETQKVSMELLGHDGDDSVRRFFEVKNHDDDSYGILSKVRDILSGHAAGGALGVVNPANTFQQECQALTADKEIKIFNWDKMQEETYRVILSNSPASSPTSFTCNTTSYNESNCAANGVAFEKRMLIYDYKVSSLSPSMAVEFNCSTKVGKLESSSVEVEGIFKNEEKILLNWNTDEASNLAYQRFERLQINKQYRYASGWMQINENRQSARVVKRSTDDYEAWVFGYDSRKNLSSTFDQSISYRRFKTVSTTALNYIASVTSTTNSDPTFILTDSGYSTQRSRTPAGSGTDNSDNVFNPNDSFPQGSGTPTATFYSLATDFPTANQFNDSVPLTINGLNSATFTGSTFGTSFLTTP